MRTSATLSVSIPEPPFDKSYKCRKRSPGSPNPAVARRHATTAVAVVVIGPIIETRPYAGEEKVSAKADAVAVKTTEPAVVKMAEVRASKAATIEAMTGEAVSAETTTAKPAVAATEAAATMASATVRHCTGRHRGAKRNSRDDRNQSYRPPHESLSFCQAPTPRWQPSCRSSGLAILIRAS